MSATDHTRARPGADLMPPTNWEELIAQRAATQQLLDAHERMMAWLTAAETPAQVEAIAINDKNNGVYVFESRERFEMPTMSIGVLNPNSVAVFFSTIGSAAPNMRSYSCPPNCLIVLPIGAGQVELGCDPVVLGANTAVCFLLRFFTVQRAYLGKGA